MAKLRLFGALTNVQILIHTLFGGKYVGTDSVGNRYYRGKPRANDRFAGKPRERRWVIYKDAPEASSVPPEWHGWLHHQTDVVPQAHNPLRQTWQKPPQENLTGSDQAYLPPGHVLRGGHRAPATGDYQPWQPTE